MEAARNPSVAKAFDVGVMDQRRDEGLQTTSHCASSTPTHHRRSSTGYSTNASPRAHRGRLAGRHCDVRASEQASRPLAVVQSGPRLVTTDGSVSAMATADNGFTLTDEQRQSLSASWLRRLAGEAGYDVSQSSLSFAPFIIGPQDGFHIYVTPSAEHPWVNAVASDPAQQEEIDALAQKSGDLAAASDLGGHLWYTITLASEPFGIDATFMDRLQEILTNQSRFVGWARLGSSILLEFREELPDGQTVAEDNPFVVHQAIIDVHIAVPGPARGPLSDPIANQIAEAVAAICTFALGRAVNLPPGIFPAPDDAVAELDSRRLDPQIGTLTRHGVPLDIFEDLFLRGGRQSVDRARNAFLSYDSAIRQRREQVALILFVVAAECLTNPYQPWKTERLTTRFIKFFDELMPDDLDALIQHDNFEVAFDVNRGSRTARALRREFLSAIYNQRSEPVHEGLSASFQGLAGMGGRAGQRRALASIFAQNAILRFLESPRTTLIGHPATAPKES